MKKLFYLLLATTIIFTSCEKETDPVTPPDAPVNGELSGDIVRDTTFKLGTYVIDGTIRVRNAVVTIEPGVTFKFTDGSAFDVAYWGNEEATIIAKGTKELPIVFTSNNTNPVKGSWDGFNFFKGTVNTVFNECIFEYGGGYSSYAMIYIEESEVTFTNCTFRHAADIAMKLRSNGFFTEFDGNHLSDIESYPISIYADQVHTIAGTNEYETSLGIHISDDRDFDKRGDFTWTNQGVPYYQEGTIRFGCEGSGSILRIEEGVVVRFMEGARWDVAYWGDNYATIIAEGTADNHIVFTSASLAPSAGDWDDIVFYEGAINSSFNYCDFEYGGDSDYHAVLCIKDAEVGVNNCQFKNNQTGAIFANREGSFSSFGGNYFGDNGSFAINICPNHVHTIVGDNTYEDMGILISDDDNLDIKGAYVWTNQGIPYTIEGTVRVGAEVPGVELSIEAGAVVQFFQNARLEIAYWGDDYGTLIANGTSTEPVIFTSASPVPSAGDWIGILFYEGSNNCVMNNCQVNYAGGNYSHQGALFLENAGSPLNLSNTLISNSSSNGISVDDDNNGSSVDYSNNVTFENITGVDYYIR